MQNLLRFPPARQNQAIESEDLAMVDCHADSCYMRIAPVLAVDCDSLVGYGSR